MPSGASQYGTGPRGWLAHLRQASTFESLNNRDYRLLWLGQAGASMGQWMDQVSRGWLIYELTHSALQLGLATAIRGLPMLFFGVIAGAVADRSNRKRQLIIAQVTNAFLNVILATLVITGHVQAWHVYVTGFLAGSVQAFQQPARQTLIGDMVGDKLLMNALALNSAVMNVCRMIGPSVAGALIAFTGAQGSYYAQAVLYVVATVWTVQMHAPEHVKQDEHAARVSFGRSIGDGLAYVARDRNIRALMLLALGPLTLAGPYTSLIPVFASDVLLGDARLQGLLLTFGGVGAFIGALILASQRRDHGYAWPMITGAVAFSLSVAVFGLSSWVPLSLLFAVIVGAFSVTYRTQTQTLLQVLAPREIRGRVMSIYLLDRGLVPLGTLGMGALAAAMGAPASVIIMGAASFVLVVLTTVLHKGFFSLKVPLTDDTVTMRSREPGPATTR